ncbi:hypothetical protein [Halorubrum sp. DTA98]|uniref:hypothetical protein n=1 Tax=Halorubrum sp. DTA98 TaxID=3402163 RepID=UPI003AAEEF81
MDGNNSTDEGILIERTERTTTDEEPVPEGAGPDATRRKFMAAGAVSWASVTLAGCTALGDEEEDDGPTTFVVTDEIVVGAEGIPEGAGGLLREGVAQRLFVPGMEVIFKVGVWDRESNGIVSDEALDEVTIELDTGDSVDLEFYRDEREWSGSWRIPDDADPGTVGYTVEVTNGAQFTNVGVLESEFEIIEFTGVDAGASNYVVTDDTYSTDDKGNGWVQSCLPQHNFTPGMAVGFDIGIYDGSTGEPVGPDVVDEAIIVFEAGDPDTVELEWDEDGGVWNHTWYGIPEDYEGTLTYEVQVTNDGNFHRVGVYQDSIEVIADPDA